MRATTDCLTESTIYKWGWPVCSICHAVTADAGLALKEK